MNTHRIETTLDKDGTLILTDLPFQAGDSVEVIILPRAKAETKKNRYPLRGTSIQYDNPTEPVAEEDWTALR